MIEHYHRTCLLCGCELHPTLGLPHTPPWKCRECHVSFWVAELTREARDAFRLEQRDWGPPSSEKAKRIREAVHREMAHAHVRGVSLRREQIGLVSRKRRLAYMATHHVAPHFARLMEGAR